LDVKPALSTEETLGETIRQLRDRRSMSVRTLAAEAGFSASFISQVENGQASPSITSLEKIASCLGVTLGEFFNNLARRAVPVTRAFERRQLTSGWSKAKMELLGPVGAGLSLEPMLVTIASNGSSGRAQALEGREEFLLMLEGELVLSLDSHEFLLEPGDSAVVRAGRTRKLENRSAAEARVVIVSARATP
jgi:transcriptional regulator with XRE-family HTH domain